MSFRLELAHNCVVFVHPALTLIQTPRLEDFGIFEARQFGCNVVAEVGILFPLDCAFDNSLNDGRGMLDPDLLRTFVVVSPADPPGRHEVHLEVGHRLEEFKEPLALESIVREEERIRTWHAKTLARFCRTAGRRSFRLAQHEVGGSLVSFELHHRWDDVLIAVEEEQIVDRRQVARIAMADIRKREGGATVRRVRVVKEVDGSVRVGVRVLEPGIGAGRPTVDGRLIVRIEPECLRKTAVLRGVDLATAGTAQRSRPGPAANRAADGTWSSSSPYRRGRG